MIATLLLQAAAAPRTPGEELASLRLVDGFVAELVAAEPEASKIVDIAFDDAGRMWAVTAVEYPLDGNESAAAEALYREGGRDRVLVFDTPTLPGPQVPRVFADGLAMPMAVLPWRDGALIGHGPEILHLRDEDGDGRADAREVVLSGFGIQDSHLMPHRFTRGPGGWIYTAQGAFNYSLVATRDGRRVRFDQCKIARFRPDGSAFEVVGHGLNNVWGFVIDRQGELFVQEANDLGYPVVPFFHHASYPGIGDHRHRAYSPWQPALSDFEMGGTGLSGLALSQERSAFPAPWDEAFFVANPIVNAVQAIALDRSQDPYRLARLPDLLISQDSWFRPVALHFGPDGCLYVVDWYNAIISHNEVPRSDPQRDKARSRIWRIRHGSMPRRAPVDVARLPSAELVARLQAESTWESRAAWHQIADRKAFELVPELERLARDAQAPGARVLALWSLEDLGRVSGALLLDLADDPDLRREAARLAGALAPDEGLAVLRALASPDRLSERLALTNALKDLFEATGDPAVLDFLLERVPAPPTESDGRLGRYREFERSLLRCALETHPAGVLARARAAAAGASEGAALACLALRPDAEAARALAEVQRGLARPPTPEELAFLAEHASDPDVRAGLAALLSDRARSARVVRELLAARERVAAEAAAALCVPALRDLAATSAPEALLLVAEAARAWRLGELGDDVRRIARSPEAPRAVRLEALRACVELGMQEAAVCDELARGSLPGEEAQRIAALGLASAQDAGAPELLLALLPTLPPAVARAALRELAARHSGAAALLAALAAGALDVAELEPALGERLRALFPEDPRIAPLERAAAGRRTAVLTLAGGTEDWVDTDVTLRGAFTVEAWVALEEPITNADGLLGAPGIADFNFHDRRARLWVGGGRGDVVIARRALEPGVWTHVALVRDATGQLRLYIDGELDAEGREPLLQELAGLDLARTTAGGTSGRVAEARVWSVARSAAEIGRDRFLRFEAPPPGLARVFSAAADFAPLHGSARVETTLDGPRWPAAAQLLEQERSLERARRLADAPGDVERGRALFARHCLTCHQVAGEGVRLGPPLDGSGLRGVEGLVRAIVTPSAAVESGYRTLVIETLAGEHLDGFLASQDEERLVLRRQSREDVELQRSGLASARFDRLSVMPEGLLEALQDAEVSDLFAYLLTLR